jgi:anti-sigma regulatory factor (Ser/Thr protein kinase)
MRSVAQSWFETFPAVAETVPRARHALAGFAARAGSSGEQIDAVRLTSSEAVTNAVLHAYRGEPGAIQVTAAVVAQELWVLIADEGCGMQPRGDQPGLGLGLGLIAKLTDDFEIVARSGGGTEVRMRFDLVDEADQSESRDLGSSSSASRPASSRFSIAT